MVWSHFSEDGSRKTVTESTISGAAGNSVRVYKSAAQSINTGVSPETLVSFDSEHHDFGSLHDNAVNNSRLTAAVTGVYTISAAASFVVNGTGSRYFTVRKNAAGLGNGGTFLFAETQPATASPVSSFISGTLDVHLNAGDYIEMFVYQNSGGALNLNGGPDGTQLTMTLADTVIIDGSGAGRVLGYAEGLFVTSAGAGDKLSITVTDPPGDVLVYAGALAASSGAAGTSVYIKVFDGAGGTGTAHTQAYFHSPAPNYYSQLSTPARKVERWSGSKTFYLNLNNSAGTPTIWGNGGGAVCTLIAELCS